jgi:hypothetical protein
LVVLAGEQVLLQAVPNKVGVLRMAALVEEGVDEEELPQMELPGVRG